MTQLVELTYTTVVTVTVDLDTETVTRVEVDDTCAVLDDLDDDQTWSEAEEAAIPIADNAEWPQWEIG